MEQGQATNAAAVRLPYEVVAGGAGPYMFLVHGMLTSRRNWDPNLDALRRRVRPVVFDLWGHGEAPTPADPAAFEVGHLVAQLDAAREELGADRIVVCGQSLGGALALRYGLAFPERVAAVIVTNSVSGLAPPGHLGSPEERARRAQAIERGGLDAIRALPFHPSRARRIAEPVRAAMAELADRVDPVAVARITAVTSAELSAFPDFDRIGFPLLLANGVLERAFQPLCELAVERIASCRVADIDAGHAVNVENPSAFDAAVDGFLRDVLGNPA